MEETSNSLAQQEGHGNNHRLALHRPSKLETSPERQKNDRATVMEITLRFDFHVDLNISSIYMMYLPAHLLHDHPQQHSGRLLCNYNHTSRKGQMQLYYLVLWLTLFRLSLFKCDIVLQK